MATCFREGKTFTVAYQFPGQKRSYIYGIKTRKLAERIRNQKSEEEQLAKAGIFLVDPEQDKINSAAAQPIEEHLAAFEKSILSRGRGPQHAQQQASLARRVFEIAKIKTLKDLDLDVVQQALHSLLKMGRGPSTCNHARGAVTQFEKWAKKNRKVKSLILSELERYNEEVDIRRKRRALTQEEVNWLLETTRKCRDRTSRRCGIAPVDRAMMYLVGLSTGYRQSALLTLSKESFFVEPDCTPPFIRLHARDNKKRRHRDQIISTEVAAIVREWLETRPARGPVWTPTPHADLSLRFRRDLEAARRAWITAAESEEERKRRIKSHTLKYVYEEVEQLTWCDFHGLRHTGITWVARRSGIAVAQKWADHSTPVLTAKYTHVADAELVDAACAFLPSMRERVDLAPDLARDAS